MSIWCYIVATRHRGSSLFPINEWPTFVHVARPLVEHPELRDHLNSDELSQSRGLSCIATKAMLARR